MPKKEESMVECLSAKLIWWHVSQKWHKIPNFVCFSWKTWMFLAAKHRKKSQNSIIAIMVFGRLTLFSGMCHVQHQNCSLPPFLAFPWNSSCQFEKEKTTLIILLNSEIASTFICYMIFAQKCLKLAFFSCKMLFSAPKQPSFVDDTVCLTCWQAGKKGCNPWAFTPAAENLKFFFPPVGPFFNHTPPDPRNLAGQRHHS